MLTYDEEKLSERLLAVGGHRSGVFAACCAERLYSLYLNFLSDLNSDEPDLLGPALDLIWKEIGSPGKYVDKLRPLYDPLEEYIGGPLQEADVLTAGDAENALIAVCYTIKAVLDHDTELAVATGRHAYEEMDAIAQNHLDIPIDAKGANQKLMNSPEVQGELRLQEEDLSDLEASAGDEPQKLAERFRSRARKNAFDPKRR